MNKNGPYVVDPVFPGSFVVPFGNVMLSDCAFTPQIMRTDSLGMSQERGFNICFWPIGVQAAPLKTLSKATRSLFIPG